MTYRPSDKGTAVIFSGKNQHEGVAVTNGTRYILTGKLQLYTNTYSYIIHHTYHTFMYILCIRIGFCNYIDPDKSHTQFLSTYQPQYDGHAATGITTTTTHSTTSTSTTTTTSAITTTSATTHSTTSIASTATASADTQERVRILTNSHAGIHIGDILRGIRVYNTYTHPSNNTTSQITLQQLIDDKNGGTLILVNNMTLSQIQNIVKKCGQFLDNRMCTLLIERDSIGHNSDLYNDSEKAEEAEGDLDTPKSSYLIGKGHNSDLNYEQRDVVKNSDVTMSKGKYWCFDDYLFLSPMNI